MRAIGGDSGQKWVFSHKPEYLCFNGPYILRIEYLISKLHFNSSHDHFSYSNKNIL